MFDCTATLGDVFLSPFEFTWPNDRGFGSVSVVIKQDARRYEELAALPWRSTLTFGVKAQRASINVRVIRVRIIDENICAVVLGDQRMDLAASMFAADINARIPHRRTTDAADDRVDSDKAQYAPLTVGRGPEETADEPLALRDALDFIAQTLNDSGYEERWGYRAAFALRLTDPALIDSDKIPTNDNIMAAGGNALQALEMLCSALALDLTLDHNHDGAEDAFVITDRHVDPGALATLTGLIGERNFVTFPPPWDAGSSKEIFLPTVIRVPFKKRVRFFAVKVPSTATLPNGYNLILQEVYRSTKGKGFVSLEELMAESPRAVFHDRVSREQVFANFDDPRGWENTVLNTDPDPAKALSPLVSIGLQARSARLMLERLMSGLTRFYRVQPFLGARSLGISGLRTLRSLEFADITTLDMEGVGLGGTLSTLRPGRVITQWCERLQPWIDPLLGTPAAPENADVKTILRWHNYPADSDPEVVTRNGQSVREAPFVVRWADRADWVLEVAPEDDHRTAVRRIGNLKDGHEFLLIPGAINKAGEQIAKSLEVDDDIIQQEIRDVRSRPELDPDYSLEVTLVGVLAEPFPNDKWFDPGSSGSIWWVEEVQVPGAPTDGPVVDLRADPGFTADFDSLADDITFDATGQLVTTNASPVNLKAVQGEAERRALATYSAMRATRGGVVDVHGIQKTLSPTNGVDKIEWVYSLQGKGNQTPVLLQRIFVGSFLTGVANAEERLQAIRQVSRERALERELAK